MLLDEKAPAGLATVFSGRTARWAAFVFSSRLQPFKRTDRLINAGVRFRHMNRSIDGRFQIICYGWDEDYIGVQLSPCG